MPARNSIEILEILNDSNPVKLKFIRDGKDIKEQTKKESNDKNKEHKLHNIKNDTKEFKTLEDLKNVAANDKINEEYLSPYEEIMSKTKEPSYMTPIRNWERRMGFVTPLLWGQVILVSVFHAVTVVYVLSMIFSETPKWQTLFFTYAVTFVAGFGVTGGVHRLWTHKSYKAKLPLKIILLFCYSVAGQNNIVQWVRDHRVHHKFSETTSDPHNSNRGFFFCHAGWLMMKKHPHVIREGKKIDMSDITGDPLISFYTRYFMWFKILLCFVFPCFVPYLLWNETVLHSVLSQAFLRYVYTLNGTWAVNSFAHLWGNKPYDWKIRPSENRGVSIVALGEGWHNYHHTFPWDYKAAELGKSDNFTTIVLDMFAKIGWAYDLKEASPELVEKVIISNNKYIKFNKAKL